MQNPERIQLQHQEGSEDLQSQIEQKTRELKDLVGFNEETGRAEKWDELSEEDRERVDALKREVEELKEKEKEFNPEREKEKLVRWAEENLGKNTEEARRFIEERFTIDAEKERIVVEDDIDLSPFADTLKEVPDNITFKGDAFFVNCTSLKEIPDNIIFEGYASFYGCTFLEEVPDNTVFKGRVGFNRCTSLEKIGDNITFGGSANFSDCTFLTQESVEKLEKMKEDGKIRGMLDLP